MRKNKTLFFEEKYGVDIKDFASTYDVDKFLENKLKRRLRVKKVESNLL
jgi:hypothetical protein